MDNSTHYFGAGPAALPAAVKQQIQSDIIEYKDTGLSILELSHRSTAFAEILSHAQQQLRTLYAISSDYKIIFVQGGATGQFDAVPLNLLGSANHASYIHTGFWSSRAAEFAKKYATVQLVEGLQHDQAGICCTPTEQWQIDGKSAYIHVTPNETIDGIELKEIKHGSIPLVADATSCLLMRPFDISQYGLIYAAAQKTMGISGLTVIIVRTDLLDRVADTVPWLYRYDVHVRENSVVNTAPVFACYVTGLMLDWVVANGGIAQMHADASLRAERLYQAIDDNELLTNQICPNNRSCINIVFNFAVRENLNKFLTVAREQGLHGLEGHRMVGGVRASMYNGTPMPAVEKLQNIMQQMRG